MRLTEEMLWQIVTWVLAQGSNRLVMPTPWGPGQLLCVTKWYKPPGKYYLRPDGTREEEAILRCLFWGRRDQIDGESPCSVFAFLGPEPRDEKNPLASAMRCRGKTGEDFPEVLRHFTNLDEHEECQVFLGDESCWAFVDRSATLEVMRPYNICPVYWGRVFRHSGVFPHPDVRREVTDALQMDFLSAFDNRRSVISFLRRLDPERAALETTRQEQVKALDRRLKQFAAIGFE